MSWAVSRKVLEENNVHASEYSSVGIDYDYYVDNNGSIDDLHKTIQDIINQSQGHPASS
jgi:dephospho-CoA kinase